jgi:hypothetical protein
MSRPLKALAPAFIRTIELDYFPPLVNPLSVNAGNSQDIVGSLTATLNGSVYPTTASVLWTLVSGPGTATFVDETSAITSVTVSQAGSYVFRLTATTEEWSVSDDTSVSYVVSLLADGLLVGGGGGSGGGAYAAGGSGGEVVTFSSLLLDIASDYPVVVGLGGNGAPDRNTRGVAGGQSTFDSFTADGGSGGGSLIVPNGGAGTLGGGGAGSAPVGLGGVGSLFSGGKGGNNGSTRGSGGGGAGAGGNGSDASADASAAGNGGPGVSSSISGAALGYGGGGGGGASATFGPNTVGTATDGGANGSYGAGNNATDGRGGGGGGAGWNGIGDQAGGDGGNGVVIIRYPGSPLFSGGTITSVGGDTVHTFTSSGTLAHL